MREARPSVNAGRVRLRTLAAVLAAVFTLARWGVAEPARFDAPQIEHFRLSNGLDVVLERNHRQPRVAVAMSYDVGWRDDPPGYAGLAHLVEHLTYRGSRHLRSYEGPELLEGAGVAEMNGVTSADRTVYYAVVPAGALELALFIESERMAFTLEAFNQSSLALERSIVMNELRLKDAVERRFESYVRRCLYGEDHAYSRFADEPENVERVTLSDSMWFFQAGYRPDRAHLVIVGNFEPSIVKLLIARHFDPVRSPSTPALVRPALKPASVPTRRVEYLVRGFFDRLVEARPAPPPGASARAATEILARILDHHLGAVLGERLGLTAAVSTKLVDLAAGSELWIWAAPRSGVAAEAIEQALDRELHELSAAPLREVLRETKAELRQRELERLEDPLPRAWAHLESISMRATPFDTSERLRAFQAVTESDVRAAAVQLMSGPHAVGTLVRASPKRVLAPEGEVTFTP